MSLDDGSDLAERAAPPCTLEPVARAFVEKLARENSKPLPELDLAAARAYMQEGQRTPFEDPSVRVEARFIANMRARILRPAKPEGVLPIVLYLHGGGWMLGAPETHARIARSLALRAQAAVVVPEYPLAPEHPYPQALEQCFAMALELAASDTATGLDGTRMAVAGDSSGGNLAAALALLAVERGGVQLALQALICPVLDSASASASYRKFSTGFNLTAETMRWFWSQYVEESRKTEFTASPLRAPDDLLARVPPAWIVTAGCDILRDEAEDYGRRLIEVGNVATVIRCAATIHNFPVVDDLQMSGPAITATAAMGEALCVALHSDESLGGSSKNIKRASSTWP